MRLLLKCLLGTIGLMSGLVAAALAQPTYTAPAYYAVDGVAADDVLNIRAEPNASAEIVGSLAYNATRVEAVRMNDGWAYVSNGESMGWASTAYLREVAVPMFGGGALPDGLMCAGTEPFWGLTLSGAGISFAVMDIAEAGFELAATDSFAGVGPLKSFVIGDGGGQSLTAIVSNEMCSDGMSDRDYARRIDMVLFQPGGPIGYSGCCSMPVN